MKNSYRYFKNTDCEYFPCHDDVDRENFNCLFCYCPLYFLGEDCGGRFEYAGKSGTIKCCAKCPVPHETGGYERIVNKLKIILREETAD